MDFAASNPDTEPNPDHGISDAQRKNPAQHTVHQRALNVEVVIEVEEQRRGINQGVQTVENTAVPWQ